MNKQETVNPSESPAPVVFANTTKPWWVRIKGITSNAEGMIHGVGSDSRVYVWHHSFVHAGKWVYHVTGR